MFFNKKKVSQTNIPVVDKLFNGTCYSVNGESLYIKNGKLYKFYSPRAEASWKLQPVTVNPLIWEPHPMGWDTLYQSANTLGFRDGTLIQNAKDGKIYLISDARRNLLTKPLADYGFDWSMVVEASDKEVQFHEEGPES